MDNAVELLQDFNRIIANAKQTIERIPDDKVEFKVHARSMTMGRLAAHCAAMSLFGVHILEDEGLDQANRLRPRPELIFNTRTECLQQLEETSSKCKSSIAMASSETLEAKWCLRAGEHIILNQSRSFTIRFLVMDHLIHHIAQLGLYLRLVDAPVPALYGPSADEQFHFE